MIISPPLLRERSGTESDADWVNRMMAADPQRSFPVNRGQSWHGGLHLTGNGSDPVRCIADGKVISLRQPDTGKRHVPPLNYNGMTDNGYVLLKHETETGSGDDGQIVYYSLYMHLNSIDENVAVGKTLYRKSPTGTAGMVDGQSGYHFQIFCDDENIRKITGRITPETDLTKDGRTDVVYGDIHFYLPAGTTVYEAMPDDNSLVNNSPQKKTSEPLFVTMSFDRGNCTMVTRQQSPSLAGVYSDVGEPLMNADGEDYEYNLYATALKLYPESPSAGYEMLRFGRVINTDYETLVPADAPLWRAVNTPQGKGIVNLGARDIRVYSDGDFPHWTGWQLVDDDTDTNSQCNSPTVLCAGSRDVSRMICHFPLEWDGTTVDSRFEWLKSPNEVLSKPMAECDWHLLTAHGKALCLAENPLPAGRVWHFDPRQFITHFRKCGWLDKELVNRIMTSALNSVRHASKIKSITEAVSDNYMALNLIMRKYNILSPNRQSHFLGQGSVESDSLTAMQEVSQEQYLIDGKQFGGPLIPESLMNEKDLGHWYGWQHDEVDSYFSGLKFNTRGSFIAGSYSWKNGNCGDIDAQKFRGRGFKMLTGRDKYADYWVYRGWLSKHSFDAHWWTDKQYVAKNAPGMRSRPAIIDEPQKITSTPYNCIDTGAFYIICFRKNTIKEIDKDLPSKRDDENVVNKVTYAINGGNIGLEKRLIMTNYAKRIMNDEPY